MSTFIQKDGISCYISTRLAASDSLRISTVRGTCITRMWCIKQNAKRGMVSPIVWRAIYSRRQKRSVVNSYACWYCFFFLHSLLHPSCGWSRVYYDRDCPLAMPARLKEWFPRPIFNYLPLSSHLAWPCVIGLGPNIHLTERMHDERVCMLPTVIVRKKAWDLPANASTARPAIFQAIGTFRAHVWESLSGSSRVNGLKVPIQVHDTSPLTWTHRK